MIWSFAAQFMAVVSCLIALASGVYSSWAMTKLEKYCASWWVSDAVLFSSLCFLVTKGLSMVIGNQSDITLTMWRVTLTALFVTSILSINKGTGLGPLFLQSVRGVCRKAAAKIHAG